MCGRDFTIWLHSLLVVAKINGELHLRLLSFFTQCLAGFHNLPRLESGRQTSTQITTTTSPLSREDRARCLPMISRRST
jgi:hypothetical protein